MKKLVILISGRGSNMEAIIRAQIPGAEVSAVIANRPFRRGELFGAVKGKPLPGWAREFECENWAQFFLKFIVSHPAVACAIPATAKVDHMVENMGAGFGRLPDAPTRQRMIDHFRRL